MGLATEDALSRIERQGKGGPGGGEEREDDCWLVDDLLMGSNSTRQPKQLTELNEAKERTGTSQGKGSKGGGWFVREDEPKLTEVGRVPGRVE